MSNMHNFMNGKITDEVRRKIPVNNKSEFDETLNSIYVSDELLSKIAEIAQIGEGFDYWIDNLELSHFWIFSEFDKNTWIKVIQVVRLAEASLNRQKEDNWFNQLQVGDKVFLYHYEDHNYGTPRKLEPAIVEHVEYHPEKSPYIHVHGNNGTYDQFVSPDIGNWCELLSYTDENHLRYQAQFKPDEIKDREEQVLIERLKNGYDKEAFPAYFLTNTWKQKRLAVFERDNHTCTNPNCSATENLDCHHLTYKNLGHEPLEDLITLCRSCHKKTHNIED